MPFFQPHFYNPHNYRIFVKIKLSFSPLARVSSLKLHSENPWHFLTPCDFSFFFSKGAQNLWHCFKMTFWPILLLGKLFRMPPPPPPIWRRPKRGANCPPRNCPCPKVSVWTRRNVPSFVKFFDKIKPVSFLSLVDGVKWWLSISKKNTKLLDNLQFWLKNWIRLVGKFYHTVKALHSSSK